MVVVEVEVVVCYVFFFSERREFRTSANVENAWPLLMPKGIG